MNRLSTIAGFLPPETFVFLIVAAGFAFMFQARAVGTMLLMTVLVGSFMPVLIEPFLEMMPLWMLLSVGAIAALAALRSVLTMITPKRAVDDTINRWAISAIGAILVLPLRAVWWFVRSVWRLLTTSTGRR